MSLVSVVIPCRNEVKAIKATVEAILASSYPSIEVLVVDGMSEDGTREVVSQLSAADPRVRLVDNPKKLTPYAFNLGIKNARGEYVQIVGARNVLDIDYIQILVGSLNRDPKIGCVGGDYQHVYDNEEARFLSLAMESKFGVGAGNYRTMTKDTFVDTVGIPLFRKSIFAEVGLFDERLTRNQDDDFSYRLRKKGYKILYVHDAKATYLVRSSLVKAYKQFNQYGYFKVFVNLKNGAVTTWRQMVPALFVAFWVIGFPLSFFFAPLQSLLSFVAFLYLVLGLAMAGPGLTLGERFKVLIACFIMHLAYGLGYWQGIWDFLIVGRAPRESAQRQTT